MNTPQRTTTRGGTSSRATGRSRGRGPKDAAPQPTTAAAHRPVMGRISDFLSRPSTDYTMLLIITGSLTFIGLIMAASITGPSAFYDDAGRFIPDADVYGQFYRQAIMVGAGIVMFYVALRTRPSTLRKFARLVLFISIALLIAVLTPLGIGQVEKGSQSWLPLGPIRLQPSEVAKLALVLFGADLLAGRPMWLQSPKITPMRVYVAAVCLVAVLILAEHDLGMTVTVVVVGFVVAILAGIALRPVFVGIAALIPLALLYIVKASGQDNFRANRLTTFIDIFTGNFDKAQTEAFQSYQGLLSLADGGLLGVGVGQSRAKWFYLPEAKNDFVFAIVGEELGTVGALLVVTLFALLGFFGMRAAARNADPFLRYLASGIVLGIVFQALYNIGYVVGILPVTGIQLPLISVGGTSTIVTLASLGLVANCARHEPEAVSAINERGMSLFDRWLKLPTPLAYSPAHHGTASTAGNSSASATAAHATAATTPAPRPRSRGRSRSEDSTAPVAVTQRTRTTSRTTNPTTGGTAGQNKYTNRPRPSDRVRSKRRNPGQPPTPPTGRPGR